MKGIKLFCFVTLANIAQRTGRTLHCDPKNGHILNDADAMKLWRREYEKGWEPKTVAYSIPEPVLTSTTRHRH